MVRNQRYVLDYAAFRRAQEGVGGDVFLAPALGYSPLQEIIYQIMGIEQFSIEWHLRRDEVMRLAREIASAPILDPRTPEEILGYDEHGLPR